MKKLGFVVPLAHPADMSNFADRNARLGRTLNSLAGQSHPGSKIIIVGCQKELPAGAPAHKYVRVNWPPVEARRYENVWQDKGAKVALGASIAISDGCDWIMPFDSDDFVSRHISGFVSQSDASSGWYLSSGYVHLPGSRGMTLMEDGFHLRNGSSHIFPTRLFRDLEGISAAQSRDAILGVAGHQLIVDLFGNHTRSMKFAVEAGVEMNALPFPGAIWELGYGGNYTRLSTKADGRRVRLSEQLAGEFSVPWPSRWEHVRSELGFRARRLNHFGRVIGWRLKQPGYKLGSRSV